jgi:hypothetical protein
MRKTGTQLLVSGRVTHPGRLRVNLRVSVGLSAIRKLVHDRKGDQLWVISKQTEIPALF